MPLRQPGLRRLTIAFLVNELGDGITSIVLPLAVYAATRSGLLTGLSFALVRGAGLVGSPLGGLLADRVDRTTLLRVSFVVRAAVLGLALVVGRDDVTLLCLLLVRVGGTVDNPAAEAAVREHAGDRPRSVATIRKVATAVSQLIGPAVGGLLVSVFGVPVAVAVDLATFVIALLVLARRLPTPAPDDDAHRTDHAAAADTAATDATIDPGDTVDPAVGVPPGPTSRRIGPRIGPSAPTRRALAVTLADARAGLAHLRSHADLRLVVASTTVNATLVAALLTTAVVYLDGLAGAPDGAYGYALAAYSAGSLAGLLVAGTIAWRVAVGTVVWRSMLAYAVICLAGVVVPDWRVLAASWLAWGIAYGPEEIVSDVALVTHTPAPLLGRTYAGVQVVSSLGQVVGSLAGGLLGDLVGPRLLVAGLAAAYLPSAAAVWWSTRRGQTPQRPDAAPP